MSDGDPAVRVAHRFCIGDFNEGLIHEVAPWVVDHPFTVCLPIFIIPPEVDFLVFLRPATAVSEYTSTTPIPCLIREL